MNFFDCNAFFGLPATGALLPVETAGKLTLEMSRAGVEKALVWHISQHDVDAQVGNRLLAEAIQPYPQLYGCWALLPNQTGEYFSPEVLFQEMKANKIRALRVFPVQHLFLLTRISLGQYLEAITERRIPLLVSLRRDCTWHEIYHLLEEFSNLLCVICDHGPWGMDRMFRPLLETYPHVYLETGQYMTDGALEALVKDYGADRLLYGSGFPEAEFGGMMLTIKHAHLSQAEKEAIAGGNLERILAEVHL